LRPFRELAFALAVGILLDAFVVRSLLAPALLSVIGYASQWPGRQLFERRRTRLAASTVGQVEKQLEEQLEEQAEEQAEVGDAR
jgi:uncharacterized membrane protein YdfJ with MMPL/SSD domain